MATPTVHTYMCKLISMYVYCLKYDSYDLSLRGGRNRRGAVISLSSCLRFALPREAEEKAPVRLELPQRALAAFRGAN